MTSSSASSDFSALTPHGWDDAGADAFAPYDTEGLLPGRVIRVDRGQCDVVSAGGVLRADTAFRRVKLEGAMNAVIAGEVKALAVWKTDRFDRRGMAAIGSARDEFDRRRAARGQ